MNGPVNSGVDQLGSLDALDLDLGPFEHEILYLLRRRPHDRQRHFLSRAPAEKIDRVLQVPFSPSTLPLIRRIWSPERIPALAAGVSSIGVTTVRQSIFHRDFDAQTVEAAPGIILHVLEVVRSP